MTFFPDIDDRQLWSIEIILRNLAEDPEYLEDSDYSPEIVQKFKEITGLTTISASSEPEEGEKAQSGDKWTVLEAQTNKLYKSLMEEQQNLGAKDNAEKMSFFRTATQLLDKLVGIQERAANLAKIHQFHDTVLTIMDDLLDAGQRTEVMDRLRKAIEA